MNSSNISLVNPLCVILVKNGSKGDRLLFRYPYGAGLQGPLSPQGNKDNTPENANMSSGSGASDAPPGANNTTNATTGARGGRRRKVSTNTRPFFQLESPTSTAPQQYTPISRTPVRPVLIRAHGPSPSGGKTKSPPTATDLPEDESEQNQDPDFGGLQMLNDLSDKDLSNLLAVGTELSERKFELKLNYVRFVGHPTLLHHPKSSYRNVNPPGPQTSVKLFHIVFCLHACASHSIVKCFHDLSKRLGIALRHEEYRCSYLAQEFKKLVILHDELCAEPTPLDKETAKNMKNKLFDDILARSKLAKLIRQIYMDVVEKGFTFMRVNGWVQISFCLPQKIHMLKFRGQNALVEPEAIHKCLEAIRPYHALLLLVSSDELESSLTLDSASTISRLLEVYSPLKSLQTLAADADLTLSHVVEIASHLVYWAQATVIYPLCESNVYVLAPDIHATSEKLKKEFASQFPGLCLAETLADFSLPMPLGERINPILGGNFQQSQQISLVTWMLKYHLLIHLHTYVYLSTYFDGSGTGNEMEDSMMALRGPLTGAHSVMSIRLFEGDDEGGASDSLSETTEDLLLVTGSGSLETAISDKKDAVEEGETKDPFAVTTTTTTTTNGTVIVTTPTTASAQTPAVVVNVKDAISELSNAVKTAVGMVKTSLSMQDIKLFSRLSKYFTGDYHLEEIMYRENVRRSQLMLLLDKFRDVLVIIEKEDSEINFLKL